ncbi:MAG: 50S ribosomal protein L29 [Planctomycetes bacterium]|nr:50S ribosomal protein L29 [Planctomycetota bacterium]
MKIDEIRSKRDSELEYDLGNLKKELFGLRFKAATETSANPSRIRVIRREIARINTILRERKTKIRGQEPR